MKQQQRQKGITVFYSYTSADRAWRDQLATHLSQLKHDELIQEWHDQQILAGSDRVEAIDQAIHSAQIILLLISADFLASDVQYHGEMQQALECHKRGETRVIPILVRPCEWQHSPFAHLQCLPRNTKPITTWNDPDEAFVTIAQELRRIIAQQQLPIPSLSPQNRQNRMRILRKVREIWIDGLLKQSLHQNARIELCLQDRPDMLASPWRLLVQELDQDPQTLPDGTTIVQVYDKAEGELLILGEPGAGKTTLLLELTATLLERAEEDERLRMPIVFQLSSWAEKRQPLQAWLVEELRTKYGIPRKIGQIWVDADHVLPLLDGLDEVAEEARTACVQAINTYYQSRLEELGSNPAFTHTIFTRSTSFSDLPPDPFQDGFETGLSVSIVVCCRSEEYTTLSTRILLQHAVSILPLTTSQINAYLEQAREEVQALKQALDKDAELHSLACQPLMLNIFTLAYQGATPAEVSTGETREETQHTLFAKYVGRMLTRRGQSKCWKPEQVIHSLSFLAKQMQCHKQIVFSVESLRPSWLPRGGGILYRLCIWLVFWPVLGLGGMVLVGPLLGLLFGPAFVPVFGRIFGHIFDQDVQVSSVRVLTRPWEEARSELLGGLLPDLLIGLFVGLIFGLIVGLSHWSIFGLSFGLADGLFFGLAGGLVLGFLRKLVLELGAFVRHFSLRFFLSQQGNLPWRLVAFLDEATGRLFLRKVGGSYIFIHGLLLDYFATLDEPVPRTPATPKRQVVMFLLALMVLGAGSIGVYDAVTGSQPGIIPGRTWHVHTSGTSLILDGITWSNSQFVTVGEGGIILTSPDGNQWTTQYSGTSEQLESVAASGSRFVTVGNYGTILTSSNGSRWTPQHSGTSEQLRGVVWSNARFVAVGVNGTILTSPDGNRWTARSSGTSEQLNSVSWSNAQFVAVGVNGTILTSPDGNRWTARSSGTSEYLWGVTGSGSQLVIVGNHGTILTSPDGNRWTPQYSGTSQRLWGVIWSDSQFVVVGGYGRVLTSPDGSRWTFQSSSTLQRLWGIAKSGSRLAIVGDNGTVLTSP